MTQDVWFSRFVLQIRLLVSRVVSIGGTLDRRLNRRSKMFIGIFIKIPNMYLYRIGTILQYIALLVLAIFFAVEFRNFRDFVEAKLDPGHATLSHSWEIHFWRISVQVTLSLSLTCLVYPNRACQRYVLALQRTRTTNMHWIFFFFFNWILKRLSLSFPLCIFGNFDHASSVLDKRWTCVDSGHHEKSFHFSVAMCVALC